MAQLEKDDEIYEPFNYPGVKESMGYLLNDGIQSRVMDSGLALGNKGRKFGYSDYDYLQAYLGRDFTRAPRLEDDEIHMTFSH